MCLIVIVILMISFNFFCIIILCYNCRVYFYFCRVFSAYRHYQSHLKCFINCLQKSYFFGYELFWEEEFRLFVLFLVIFRHVPTVIINREKNDYTKTFQKHFIVSQFK